MNNIGKLFYFFNLISTKLICEYHLFFENCRFFKNSLYFIKVCKNVLDLNEFLCDLISYYFYDKIYNMIMYHIMIIMYY